MEIKTAQMRHDTIDRETMHKVLMRGMGIIRQSIETLQRQHGPDAADIVNEAIIEAERLLDVIRDDQTERTDHDETQTSTRSPDVGRVRDLGPALHGNRGVVPAGATPPESACGSVEPAEQSRGETVSETSAGND